MNLSEIEIKFPDFKIDGRHGSRVGYWCVKCEKPITINDSNGEITWDSIAGLLKVLSSKVYIGWTLIYYYTGSKS